MALGNAHPANGCALYYPIGKARHDPGKDQPGGNECAEVDSKNTEQTITLNKPLPIASFSNSFGLPNEFILALDADYQGKGHVQNVRTISVLSLLIHGKYTAIMDEILYICILIMITGGY